MLTINKFFSLLFLFSVLILNSNQVSADADWNPAIFCTNNNWSNACNWLGLIKPAKSAATNVRIRSSAGESIMNEDWQLRAIEILQQSGDVNLNLRNESNEVLTLHFGIDFANGCANLDCEGASGTADVHVPITIASEVDGIGFRNRSANNLRFFGNINTNGKALQIINDPPILTSTGQPLYEPGEIELYSVISGTGRLFKEGNGIAILRGNNTYTGSTFINEGILQLRGSGRIHDSSTVFVNDSIFRLIGITDAVNGLNGNGRVIVDPNSHLVIGNYPGSNSTGNGNFTGQLDLLGDDSRLSKRGTGTQIIAGQVNNNNLAVNAITVEDGLLWFTSTSNFLNTPSFELLGTGNIQFDSQKTFRDIIIDSTNQIDLLNTFDIQSLILARDTDVRYFQTTGNTQINNASFGQNGYGTYLQSGGENEIKEQLILGAGVDGVGEYGLSGGSFIAESVEVGYDGEGIFSIDGINTLATIIDLRVGGRDVLNSSGFAMFDLHNGTLETDQTTIGKAGSAGFTQKGGTHKVFSLNIGSDSTVAGAGTGFYVMDGGLIQSNQISILQNGEFDFNDGEIQITGAGGFLATGGGIFRFNGGTLSTPLVLGSLVNSGGTLSPGNSPGITRITGNYFQSDGELLIEIAGTDPTEIDSINVDGSATIQGGKIIFSFLDDFLPTEGFTFNFLTAGGNLSLSDRILYEFLGLADGFEFDVSVFNQQLVFTALNNGSSPIPIPASVWLLGTALMCLFKKYKGQSNIITPT